MVLFSSSAALVQYALLGRLNPHYAMVFASASVVASAVGVLAVSGAVRRSGRPSLVVFALVGVVAAGCVLVAAFGMSRAVGDVRRHGFHITGLC